MSTKDTKSLRAADLRIKKIGDEVTALSEQVGVLDSRTQEICEVIRALSTHMDKQLVVLHRSLQSEIFTVDDKVDSLKGKISDIFCNLDDGFNEIECILRKEVKKIGRSVNRKKRR
jgi:hypothetical protein